NDVYYDDVCPEYDEAGNFIGLLATCPEDRNSDQEDQEDVPSIDYASKIFVAPNPTSSIATISWNNEVQQAVAEIIVVHINGAQQIPISFSKASLSANVNLSAYPSGIYVVRFTFQSGQIVTKSIIKI